MLNLWNVQYPMRDADSDPDPDPIEQTKGKKQHGPTGCRGRCHAHGHGRFGGWNRISHAPSQECESSDGHAEGAGEDKPSTKEEKHVPKKQLW